MADNKELSPLAKALGLDREPTVDDVVAKLAEADQLRNQQRIARVASTKSINGELAAMLLRAEIDQLGDDEALEKRLGELVESFPQLAAEGGKGNGKTSAPSASGGDQSGTSAGGKDRWADVDLRTSLESLIAGGSS